MKITQRTEYYPTHKTGLLSPTVTVGSITKRLGVLPLYDDSDDCRVSLLWEFNITDNDKTYPCGIWDYKGARWSVYGPPELLGKIFGSDYQQKYSAEGLNMSEEQTPEPACTDNCGTRYNCCDCGTGHCGCYYCWSCNACEVCNPPDPEE